MWPPAESQCIKPPEPGTKMLPPARSTWRISTKIPQTMGETPSEAQGNVHIIFICGYSNYRPRKAISVTDIQYVQRKYNVYTTA